MNNHMFIFSFQFPTHIFKSHYSKTVRWSVNLDSVTDSVVAVYFQEMCHIDSPDYFDDISNI